MNLFQKNWADSFSHSCERKDLTVSIFFLLVMNIRGCRIVTSYIICLITLDAKEYEKITHAFILLKLLVPAEEDIRAGRYKEAKAFFKEFKRDQKI